MDEEFLDATLKFIDRAHQADKPFFVWFNTTRMHVFTHLKPESQGKTGLGLQADGMTETDGHVGQLLKKLDDLKIADNTILVYTTDNGPMVCMWPDGGTTPFRSEKDTNGEGSFRVPCVIRWPGVIKPGKALRAMKNADNPAREAVKTLADAVGCSIIGQEHVVRRLIIALLANGNVLVEGLPGLAKTRAVKSLARVLEAGLSRIQFTPDLLPSDITGTEVYYSVDGKGEFRFQQGPVFNNLILADEINRAPAKVQAALLEAMEERQVTVAGKTYKLPDLFMVMATQNPIEQEGTYPLPEAQMDRFLMHVFIDYPDEESEMEVIRLVRAEECPKPAARKEPEKVVISQEHIFEARSQIYEIHVSEAIDKYIVDLIIATRRPERYGEDLKKWIHVGASPRGAIGLDKCARVHAWLEGRDYVTPDDVREVLQDVLRHRVLLSYEAHAEGIDSDRVVREIAKRVAVA